MSDRLQVDVGGVRLANPVICGSGEHLITSAGVRAAAAAGAGAVVVKSTNESDAARRQLAHTDYALFDADWRRLPWDFDPPRSATLLNRSGLYPGSFDDWLAMTAELVRSVDTVIVPSLIPADYDVVVDLARRAVSITHCQAIEINAGAPHGREAAPGNIALETEAGRMTELVRAVRSAVDVSLWIKITGQSESVSGLAQAAFDGGADAVTLMGRHMGLLPDVETQRPELGTMAAVGGVWALPLTCRWLALSRARVGRARTLVGTNGARSGLDVARFLLAGATAAQLNSVVFTSGFEAISDAIRELDTYLAARGDTAAGIVGRAADRVETYAEQRADEHRWHAFVPTEARPYDVDVGDEDTQ